MRGLESLLLERDDLLTDRAGVVHDGGLRDLLKVVRVEGAGARAQRAVAGTVDGAAPLGTLGEAGSAFYLPVLYRYLVFF